MGYNMGYNIDNYPTLSDLNSEINEQANSGLKNLKSQLSYMKQIKIFNHLKLYLWYKNNKLMSSF